MSDISFVPTQRGGVALIHDGFRYNKVRSNSEKRVVYWRCSKSRNCCGRAVTIDDRIKKTNNKHNHPPEVPLSSLPHNHHLHHQNIPFLNMAAVAAAAAHHHHQQQQQQQQQQALAHQQSQQQQQAAAIASALGVMNPLTGSTLSHNPLSSHPNHHGLTGGGGGGGGGLLDNSGHEPGSLSSSQNNQQQTLTPQQQLHQQLIQAAHQQAIALQNHQQQLLAAAAAAAAAANLGVLFK